MKVNISNEDHKSRVNKIIDTLVSLNFQVRMFAAVNDSIFEFLKNYLFLDNKCFKNF